MPFKSQKQAAFMFAAEKRGEVPPGTAERWAKETKTPINKLPVYKKQKKTGKKIAKRETALA